MKKWLIGFLIVSVAILAAIYVFIPNKVEISKKVYITVPSDIAYRFVSDEGNWIRWWPGQSVDPSKADTNKPASFIYNRTNYAIIHKMNVIQVLITHKKDRLNSTILIIPLKKDSSALHWKGVMETGSNPFEKIQRYRHAKNIKKNMGDIFKSLQSFLENKENLYTIPIQRTTVRDTLLVSIKVETNHYPSTTDIYNLIADLKQYISRQAAKETNYPMLHVLKTDSNRFQTMVAIPVNRELKNSENYVFKRMVPGSILVAEVKGGIQRIEKASAEMETYINDNQLVPPAIPFESLVTNRMTETDSTKWITRLYYPIL